MLPVPDPKQQAESHYLSQLIRQEIEQAGGWIGFDRYMALVLYTPELGYYAGQREIFGPNGDYITAPMLGPLFADCLAQQCAEILDTHESGRAAPLRDTHKSGPESASTPIQDTPIQDTHKLGPESAPTPIQDTHKLGREGDQGPDLWVSRNGLPGKNSWVSRSGDCSAGGDIIEFGAGRGDLAANLLLALDRLGVLPDRYCIMEPSAGLKERQRSRLAELPRALSSRVCWVDQIPDQINGVVLANEVLDAMPFHRFEVNADGRALAVGVTWTVDGFQWQLCPSATREFAGLSQLSLEPGYSSEWCEQAEGWVRTVGERLVSGTMLLLDYGFPRAEYYHPERSRGTMMCHFRHHSHEDPFYWPGLQDITAHIDFSAIAAAGESVGLQLAGYCDQANFLLSCRLADYFTERHQQVGFDSKAGLALAAEVKKLTMPHEMGELFKVIALSKSRAGTLTGFSQRNLAHRLQP